MIHTSRRRDWTALGLLLAAVALGFVFRPTPTPQQAAAPVLVPAPAPQVAPDVPIEARFGGQLRKGVWHYGYVPNPQATRAFVASLARPTLDKAAPDVLRRANDRTPVLLYRALYEAFAAHQGGREWVVGQQQIGDCVSWGWGHGVDIQLAVLWKLGEVPEWRTAATEAIYGGSRVEARCGNDQCRGGWSDGSYGGAAAKYVTTWGLLFRQPYDELGFDLTEYSGDRADKWGNYGCGGQGDNGRADAVAKEHPVRQVVLVRTFEEAAAAIAAGYPVPVCSGRGFSHRRDAEGFCRPSGGWSHCMCFIGVRFDRPGLLCLNSWGPDWVDGPKWPEDMPEGSFWVDAETAGGMLAGEDSFAVAAADGFRWRDLHHGDWAVVTPAQVRQLSRKWRSSTDKMQLSLAP